MSSDPIQQYWRKHLTLKNCVKEGYRLHCAEKRQTMRISTTIALAFLVSVASQAAASAGEPSEAVRPFYLQPGLELEAAARDRFIDPARKILDQNDVIRQGGEEGCLDPSLPFNDTDFDAAEAARTLVLGEVARGDEATVLATFMAEGEKHSVQWRLKNVAGAWKIFDMVSMSKDWALSQFVCE